MVSINLIKAINEMPPCLGYANLLSQENKDQGDTAQRVGTLFALLGIIKEKSVEERIEELHPDYVTAMNLLEAEPGVYRRTPDPAYWGSNPRFMSRDQLSILKLAMLIRKDKVRLWDCFKAAAKRLFFHQNYKVDGPQNEELGFKIPDPMTPAEWGVYARAFMGRASVLVTSITDLFFIVDMIAIEVSERARWDGANMLITNVLVADKVYPNIVTKFVKWLIMRNMNKYLDQLAQYHLKEYGRTGAGCPPLYYLFNEALNAEK